MPLNLPAPPVWKDLIRSGNRLFIGSCAAVPNALIGELIKHRNDFNDLQLLHGYTVSDHAWLDPKLSELFSVNTFYIGDEKVRDAVAEGRVDYTPSKQSEISALFDDEIMPLDVALVMVSPPDEYGYCSLGVSVDITMTAAKQARHIIAQVNPLMPRTNGYSHLHVSELSAAIVAEQVLPEQSLPEEDEVTERIGQYLAMLVDDGATLQVGNGKAPRSVLKYLRNHRDLGVHSEMISDGMKALFEAGVINNRRKTFHPGKMVTTYCYGSKALYDFVDNNPHVEFYPAGYLESPANIARNDNMTAINAALEVDLTGQVVSDSLGYFFYSGIGGTVDFINGASKSAGGKPIIALPSTGDNGKVSRIVAHIAEGAGIITTRGNVHYVVTEYGVASLKGKSIRERALELIRIAHPKFREELLAAVRQRYWVPDYQHAVPVEIPEWGYKQVKQLKIDNVVFDMRPLNPADERYLQTFFYSHTKETLRLRYHQYPRQMSREKSCNLVSVDQREDLALGIVRQRGSVVQIKAVGRFYKNPDNSCEVAFVTMEKYHGKGMASTLLKELISVARQRQLERMIAYVLPENKPMIHVFESHGFKRVRGHDEREVVLVLQLATETEKENNE
jgi:acyl-CoA hydrolase/ribosomal protein S18 acetylase RimI-like enzyme